MYPESPEEYQEMMNAHAYAEEEARAYAAQCEAEAQEEYYKAEYQREYEEAKQFFIQETMRDSNFAMLSGTMTTIINAMINYKNSELKKPNNVQSDQYPNS